MWTHFTGRYSPISSGYLGQLVEWPEVVTEGATLEECREKVFIGSYEVAVTDRLVTQVLGTSKSYDETC